MAELPPPFDDRSFHEHARFVRALAGALARDRNEAEEVAARTFARAVEQRPRQGATLRGWFASVARRALSRLRRDDARRMARESAAAQPVRIDADPADLAARAELSDRIAVAFAQLDEPAKTTLFLRFFDDLTPKQIAARQQVPVETVKTRLKRGLARLRARLDEPQGGARGNWRATAVALAQQGAPILGLAKFKAAAAAIVVAAVGIGVWKVQSRPRTGTSAAAPPAIAVAAAADEESSDARSSASQVAVERDDAAATATRSEEKIQPVASGIVVDETGRPVVNARVVASVIDRWKAVLGMVASIPLLEERSLEEKTVARSGADGRFVVLHAPDDLVGFYFVADDHVRSSWFDLSPNPAENADHRVVLATGCVLRGRVHDGEGRPISCSGVRADDYEQPSGTLTARNLEGAPTYFRGEPSYASARCDPSSGRFELHSLPRSSCRITVGALGYVDFVADHDADDRDCDVRLFRNRPILDVTDARTGAPIASARAFLGRADEPGHRALLSPGIFLDPLGLGVTYGPAAAQARFVLNSLTLLDDPQRGPCTFARLLFFAEGYRPETVDVAIDGDGEPPQLPVALRPEPAAPSISGTIVGGDDAVVRVCSISPLLVSSTSPLRGKLEGAQENEVALVQVGRDGRFDVRGLPSETYRLVVQARGHAPRSLEIQAPAHDLKIELPACAELEVVAIDAAGEPRAGATVHVQTRDREWAWSRKTDAHGVALFPALPDGSLRLVAASDLESDTLIDGVHPFDDNQFDPCDDVMLSAGEKRRVQLRIVEPVEVTFHVSGGKGRSVEGAGIELAPASCHAPTLFARELQRTLHWLVLESDCDGDAHVTLLPSTWTLAVRAGGRRVRLSVQIPKQASARIELPIGDD